MRKLSKEKGETSRGLVVRVHYTDVLTTMHLSQERRSVLCDARVARVRANDSRAVAGADTKTSHSQSKTNGRIGGQKFLSVDLRT